MLAAPPSLVRDARISPARLKSLPLVMREDGSGTRKVAEEQLAKAGIKTHDLNIAGVMGSTSAVKEAVASGLGASIFSRLSIEKELSDGVLREIPIKGIEMKRNFYAVTHKRRQLSAPYSLFMNSLNSLKTT